MMLAISSALSEYRSQRMKSVMPRAFPTLSQNRVVVLRIEPLCFSLLPGAHPSSEVKDIASDSLTAIALSPFAAGELQGSGAAMSAGVCLWGLLKVNGGLTWVMAPCGNPPPSGRVSGGEPSRIKIGTLKGPPIFSWTVQQLRGDVVIKIN
ncbi:hypothetical protein ACXMRQ_000374 [Shigella boydii]